LKNTVLVHKSFRNISEVAELITEIGENLFLSTSLSSGLQFLNFERCDLFIIDESYLLSEADIEALHKVKSDVIVISENGLDIDLQGIASEINKQELIKNLQSSKGSAKFSISSISTKKAPNIFREFDTFKDSITQEVRRAKRYQYPLVVVMFQLVETDHIEGVINYFSSKIREFDSLWITDNSRFSMVLPHTGWNGAEILTNRLTTHITGELGIDVESLKNKIISFKRIESDSDFINRIKNGLDSEYYNINKDIDFNIWKEEIFSEFIEGKTVRIFNRYKGMLISHDSDIILKGSTLELHNIRPLQLSIINNEKATYFYSTPLNKSIRAGVEEIDVDRSFATLTSFEIIDSSFIKNTSMKLLVEDSVEVKISNHTGITVGKLLELSLDEITITVEDRAILQNEENFTIQFSLDFKGKSHTISTTGNLKNIEEGRDISYADFTITTSLSDNMKISEFLSNKQIKFIKELKSGQETR
jgi:hypothetical protein